MIYFNCAFNMPTIKVVYAILLSGLVLYLLSYSLIVRKLPVIKIYFEAETAETRGDDLLQQDVDNYSSLKANGKITTERSAPIYEVSSREESSQILAEGSREKEQNLRVKILSFLEGLGVPMNKAEISHVNNPTTSPPRVNPNGVSLPMLMRKMDRYLNLSADKLCPTSHLRKVGLLAVDNNTVKLEDVEHELDFVYKGGRWKPNCKPRAKVAIVVPFRDRHAHLYTFLRHMHQFLKWQLLDYRIFIIEQADNERFNRGMLMNVGFSEAMKASNFSCVIFHDVDLLPEDARNDYSCPSSPRHMSTAVNSMEYILTYKTLFGGVEGFWSEHYRNVNGFPNRFWGWGGEDDDLYVRITQRQLGLTRPAQMIGRYTMLGHVHADDDKNPQRFEELKVSGASMDMDGLNTLAYSVLDYQEMPLYTMITVSLR